MRLISSILALVCAAMALPSQAGHSSHSGHGGGDGRGDQVSPRPHVSPHPKHPRHPVPFPLPRSKVCYVKTHGDEKTDDSPYIMAAFRECNHGGHVVFKEDEIYLIGTAMDWTFLKDIDIGL